MNTPGKEAALVCPKCGAVWHAGLVKAIGHCECGQDLYTREWGKKIVPRCPHADKTLQEALNGRSE